MRLQDVLRPQTSEREWKAARAVWAAMAAIVILAVAGLFGDGPLAERTWTVTQGGATYSVDLERFNRREHVATMAVAVSAPGATGEELRVTLPPGLLDVMTVRSTVPPATESEESAAGATYVFAVEDWGAQHVVTFEYIMRDWSSHGGPITLQAGEAPAVVVDVRQFVFP